MNLGEIEQQVTSLDTDQGFDLIYDLLRAYGLPKASIARLRTGTHNRSDREDERLWKGKVYYRFVQGTDDLHDLIDDASTDPRVLKERPRFLIVTDSVRLLALDTLNDGRLDTTLADLPSYFEFFLPWAGIEKTQLENLNYADVKAAEKMARLYDEIIKHNQIATADDVHHLNVFFSRLLFCFFAEDTQVFEPSQFTNAIASMTNANGEDVHTFLDELFTVLNTEQSVRMGLPSRFRGFGYVNGNLFNQQAGSPRFSAKARRIVLECGTLDWSQINPDIFGSMIQAVVHPSQREGLGMHYTSVENIMKVIRPLFLDGLHEAFEAAADSQPKLQRLLNRIWAIKVFDPACGSGNFLVIAYKELRKLEHRILQRIGDLDPNAKGLFSLSGIRLENFYGIEIDDFAHEIAILSLWLAKHQMNVEFYELFGVEISLIPLRDTGNVVCGNATQLDWEEICPKMGNGETYVLGNPPYAGSSMQTADQKGDFVDFFGTEGYPRNLDYIALWFLKGTRFVSDGLADLGFVSTNSVCQGDHVGLLWPSILDAGVSISFAYQSFRWSNQAKGKAGVTCVVIGLSANPKTPRTLYFDDQHRSVKNINPYLTATEKNTIVHRRSDVLSGLPSMVFGSKPTDGGYLNFSEAERLQMISNYPDAERYVRRYMGAQEFISGTVRFCLWISDEDAGQASVIPDIKKRLEGVRAARMRGSSTAQAMADRPYRFLQRAHKDTPSIIIPCHSSEKREYIPMGFLDRRTVISNAAMAIYDAEPWVFGVLQSRMHMVWVRAITGRIKTDFRYSAEVVYNTFPMPEPTDHQTISLTKHVFEIVDAREQFSSKTLAELYDPGRMPEALRAAHRRLDSTVDELYRKNAFHSDQDRLEMLFEMYEKMVAGQSGVLIGA
jgi:type I restriction-modification system DNA methylase subunit